MARTLSFLAAAAIFILPASIAPAGDWSQWRGDERDGVVYGSPPLIEKLPEEGLKPLWISEVNVPSGGNGGWGSPVVADGRVYVFAHTKTKVTAGDLPKVEYPGLSAEQRQEMSEEEIAEYEQRQREEQEEINKHFRHDELLYCFDAETGRLLWKNEHRSVRTGMPQSGTPLVADNGVFILSAGLTARRVDAETGEELWSRRLPGEFHDEHLHSSFATAEGVAVVLAKGLFGLEPRSGQVIWQADEEKIRGHNSSPVVWRNGKREWVIVNVSGGQTVCVDPQTGRETWRVASEAENSTPVIVGERLLTYGGSRKGGLRCFDLTQTPPQLLWTCQSVADAGSSPVATGNRVYAQGERRLASIDPETGKVDSMLRLDLEQPRYTSLAAADDKVFYTFEGVLCIDARGEKSSVLYNAKIDNNGLLAEEETLRQMLKIDELERTPEGQKEAEQLWRSSLSKNRPLACSSPAIADGKLYLRTQSGLICYDLRAEGGVESSAGSAAARQ
jgi:outer membrane protein assembly factor BamB